MKSLRQEKNTPWINAPFFILALNAGDVEEEQQILKSFELNDSLPAAGCYKGEQEQAWIIPLHYPKDKEDQKKNIAIAGKVHHLARKYRQESVLMTNTKGYSFLIYTHPTRVEIIGLWCQCSKETALQQDGYTFFNGQYYVVV